MRVILVIVITLLATVGCNNSSNNNNVELAEWALENSQKIETIEFVENQSDLNSLKQIVGEAEIVCLGESRHDIHEQFKIKTRFIKYLVEELNFTCFALEASFPYSNKINDYVLNGNGNLTEIMANMPAWFLWDTKEIESILNWIKEFNKNKSYENKVKFYGIDIVAPNNALEQIFDYLQKVDIQFYNQIKDKNFARKIIDDNNWQKSLQHYSELLVDTKQILTQNYSELMLHIKQNETNYINKSSRTEYDWVLKLSYSANEANKMFIQEDRIEMGLIRDNAMANISLWVKERNDKIIIWAHNVHIAKSEFTMNMFPGISIQGMGYILHKKLNNNMISIGALFNKGEFKDENKIFESAKANTVDGALAGLRMDYFLLDFHGKTENKIVESWLNTNNIIRGQNFEMTCIPIKSFDAMYFTNNISKVNYKQTALEKFKN